MKTDKEQAWYSYWGTPYRGSFPGFFDTGEFPWAKELEKQFPLIRNEIENFLRAQGDSIEPYFNADLVSSKKAWKFGKFYFWGTRNADYCRHIPEFEKILLSIPGFVTAGISVLSAQTDIREHVGDTNTIVRGHLGLKIPANLPDCGLRVKDESRSWEEGRMLLFCDAHLHKAWNHSNQLRYVLIIDVLHQDFLSQQNEVCANVLSMMDLQKLEQRFPFVKKLPGPMRGMMRAWFKKRIVRRFNQ